MTETASHQEALRQLATEWPAPANERETLAKRFERLLTLGIDSLPLPAGGQTLSRWQSLAHVARLDLGLAKLFEGHTDALAILADVSNPRRFPHDARWAVWAAEPPFAQLAITPHASNSLPLADESSVVLDGMKAWCSGAHSVSHALVTAWYGETPYLAAVALDQAGISITQAGWHAVGMAVTASVEVQFEAVDAVIVGGAEGYVQRPGFWHGGIGVAACWWGGAIRIGEILLKQAASKQNPHRLAHLGAVDVALSNGAARLREAANWIDAHPDNDAQHLALSARAAIDDIVARVTEHAGRALGAGAYCRDPAFSRMIADLPVFVRQSHAEHDLAAIGQHLVDTFDSAGEAPPNHGWSLLL